MGTQTTTQPPVTDTDTAASEAVRMPRVEERADEMGKKAGRRFAIRSDPWRVFVARTPASLWPRTGPAADVSSNPLVTAPTAVITRGSHVALEVITWGTSAGEANSPLWFPAFS